MDNLTHSLAGWTLGQAGLKSHTRKGLAALILAANMPDIDVFFGRFPWEPLATHRGFTHGLIGGVLLMPPLLFGLLLLLDRWQVRRGVVFKSGLPLRPSWLLALCYLGALTHPLLDLLTTYSVQLLSPVSGRWYHADGLFIVDVWIWLVFVLAIGWSQGREAKGLAWQRGPQAAIALVIVYIALNLGISGRAFAAARLADPRADAMFASPPPLAFWRRDLAWRDGDCYRRSSYDPLRKGLSAVKPCEPTGMHDPLVRRAIERDPRLRKFMQWSILPQASVTRLHCAARVTIGDARYGRGRRSRLAHEIIIPTEGPGCPARLDNRGSSS